MGDVLSLRAGARYFERHRYGRGPLVEPPIVDPKGLFEHCFDAEGRLILVRGYNELRPREQGEPGEFIQRPCDQTFYEYFRDHVDEFLFSYRGVGTVTNVARYDFDQGRLVEITRRFKSGKQSVEELVWGDGELRQVKVSDANGEHTDHLRYVAGQLASIEWGDANGARSETFWRVAQPLEALLQQIEAQLIVAVEERLVAQRLPTPIAAVALWLNLEGYEHVLPPGIAVLTELSAQACSSSTPTMLSPACGTPSSATT